MKRPYQVYLLVLSGLALFGGLTWLTRNPDAEVLRRAEDWPYVGSLAVWFREAYRPPQSRPASTGPEPAVVDRQPPPAQPTPRFDRHVWALAGMELKESASPQAPTIYEFERIARVGRIERRGDWFHVYYRGRRGWVLLEGYDEDAEVPFGEEPEPTLPVPARPADEERLAAARRYLGSGEHVARIGPYDLYTDHRDDRLISYLDAVAGQLEAAYAARYGRRPIGEPAEAVVLHRSDIAYRLLQRQSGRIAGLESAGHNAQGVAVLYSGGRSNADVAATVVHELVHFINRRAVGPQLPPWLDEGLADDVALSRIDEAGRIHIRELGGEVLERQGEVLIGGGLAALWRLREAARAGAFPQLPGLMRSDWESFVKTPRAQLHYDTAALWIRFLLDGANGRHAAAFRSFLGAVAEGGPATAEALGARLGDDWSELGGRFRAWVEEQAARAELPPDPKSPVVVPSPPATPASATPESPTERG